MNSPTVRPLIVSTAPIGQIALDMLREVAEVVTAPSPEENALLILSKNAIGIVCRGEGKVSRRVIEACTALRVIGRPGAGFDSVDIRAATESGIPVIYAPVGGFAVAEGALALLLALVKKVSLGDALVKSGQWRRRYEVSTGDMMGHTLGLIGVGRIGTHLARLAQAFDMRILGYDPFISKEAFSDKTVRLVALEELLARSDYVSVHVPLTDQTRGLIGKKTIPLMKTGALLVNTARGQIIEDLDVLADALDTHHLAGVALDVFPVEPPDVSHRIFAHSNFLASPHLQGVSDAAMDRIYRSMAADMVAVLKGERPVYCVNPQVFS